MKKLTLLLCLMLLCVALFSSRLHADFIYDITEFEQYNGTNTFTDTFDGTEEPEDPDYGVINPSGFGSDRQSGGLLELHSDDAVGTDGDRMLAAGVADNTFYYTGAGHLIGKFELNNGDFSESFLGIRIGNFLTDFGEPVDSDEAMMGIFMGDTGNRGAFWDDGITNNYVDISTLWTTNLITLKLEIDEIDGISGLYDVTAMWDYNSDGSFELTQSSFTALSFNFDETGEYYTGAFMAGEPVPEPATIALLGIGLVGIGGGYLRRRKRHKMGGSSL